MLYDNALLVRLYLHAFQITGNPMYRRIVEETLEYVMREMTSPEGGFYSAQDADSEGVEGKFFIWLPQEITETLGDEDGDVFCRYYGVTPHGNFEGRNILRVAMDAANLARDEGLSAEEFTTVLERSRSKLLAVRNKRIAPGPGRQDADIVERADDGGVRGGCGSAWAQGLRRCRRTQRRVLA